MMAALQLSAPLPSLSLGSAFLAEPNILSPESLKQALATNKSPSHQPFKASPSSTLGTCIAAFDIEIQTYEQKVTLLEEKKAQMSADHLGKDGALHQELEELLAKADKDEERNDEFKQKMDDYPKQISHMTQRIPQLQASVAPLMLEFSAEIKLFEQNFNHIRTNFSEAQGQIKLEQDAQKSIQTLTQSIGDISSNSNIFDKLNKLKEKLGSIDKEIKKLELKKAELTQALPIVLDDYQNFILSLQSDPNRMGRIEKERKERQAVYNNQCEIIYQDLMQLSSKLGAVKAHKKNLQTVVALSEASAKAAQAVFSFSALAPPANRPQSQSVPPLSPSSPMQTNRSQTCPPASSAALTLGKHPRAKESELEERKKSHLAVSP